MPAEGTMQRVMITIPPGLLAQLNEAATKANQNRSRLIRDALERYLDELRRQELRESLKEGYVVHAARDLRIAEEFAAADYDATARHVPPAELGPPA